MNFEDRFQPNVAEALKSYSSTGYSGLLGIEVTEVEPGRIVCTLPVRDELLSAVGMLHGGALSSLIDHTLSLAVYPLVEPGAWVATLEFKVNYLRPTKEGVLRAIGQVISLRKELAVVRVEVMNGETLVAHAQGTLYVKDRK